MADNNVRKLGDVLRSLDRVMLTTVDRGGRLVSRPMALRVDQFNGSLLLFAPVKSRIIANISVNPKGQHLLHRCGDVGFDRRDIHVHAERRANFRRVASRAQPVVPARRGRCGPDPGHCR